ncbi:MAG TPA: glycosyltransferase family 4 protein [Anaerolineae bacterium]|nr:glycosyltransferase family 4 protein [Anaerolineae bacterium]
MNLLYTITAYPPSIGGAQAHFHELARRLAQRHRLQVAAHWFETRTDWLLGTTLTAPRAQAVGPLDGVPRHQLALSTGERLLAAPFVASYYVAKGLAIACLSNLLLTHLEPVADGLDLVHNGRVGREGLSFASQKLARRLDVPFVLTPFHHPRWTGWNYRHYIDLYRRADAVIALTEAEKQELIRLGVEARRIFVTGMGPILAGSPCPEAFRRRYDLHGPIVLFLGQKYRYKGVSTLLQAAPLVWARVPDAHLVFIGPRTRHSEFLFARHAERRILELGGVDLQTKTDALAASTLLCLPSTQESFGAVFTEAWMLEKPVIGGKTPAVSEIIDEGVDGYLVEQDPAALAERIIYLLEHPRIGEEMGRQGKRKTVARYTWQRLARRTEEIYETILRGSTGSRSEPPF